MEYKKEVPVRRLWIFSIFVGILATLLTFNNLVQMGFHGYMLWGYPFGWRLAYGILWIGLLADIGVWSALTFVVTFVVYRLTFRYLHFDRKSIDRMNGRNVELRKGRQP